ncbi:hypothetical protein GW17_00040916 [Ensete ventricosum]|nr:hypothetical protein GW17_00040916 [Ensete ventricosum]RZR88420.1 hypothetical protein BHM03_00015994 [Ensete ventricosum]
MFSADCRAGTIISEGWEDGQALKDLNAHFVSSCEPIVLHVKVDMEYNIACPKPKVYLSHGIPIFISALILSKEEETYLKEKDRYELEKGRLIREMKRIRDEDGSRFNNFPILNQRYALLNLLGKGGFSEVYKVHFVNVFTKL